MTKYAIKWNHTPEITTYSTYDAALAAVRAVLTDPEIGHSGDIADGGERTLFWTDAARAENDDGSRAAGAIVRRHVEGT